MPLLPSVYWGCVPGLQPSPSCRTTFSELPPQEAPVMITEKRKLFLLLRRSLAGQCADGFIVSAHTYDVHDFMSEPMQENTDDIASLQPYRQAYLGNAAAHCCNANERS